MVTIPALVPIVPPAPARPQRGAVASLPPRPAGPARHGGPVDLLADLLGVEAGLLLEPGRGPAPAAFARQTAMYLAHTVLGLSLTEVGRAFRRDRTTAAHACRRLELLRECAELDARLHGLEGAARRAAGARGRA